LTYLADRYKILELISEGIRSIVYKAKDTEKLNVVALKIIKPGIIDNENFIANLIDEATVLNNMECPYITKIYDVGTCNFEGNQHYYIAMEYIEGESLDKILQLKEVDINLALSIIKQIAHGIDVAHRYNIIHGDLQPRNIIVDEKGLVKINNFGIVTSNNNVFKNNIQKTVGQIDYLSPEQVSIGHTEKSSDMYSLGILFYKLIFKKRPYYSEDNMESLLMSMNKGIKWSGLEINDIPDEVINIIKKLTKRSRKERYKDNQKLLVDIAKCIYEETNDKEEVNLDEDVIKVSLSRMKKRRKLKKLQRKRLYKISSIGFLALISIGYYALYKLNIF
jgi:eukaryotic-like serine/threonine-protein kinase